MSALVFSRRKQTINSEKEVPSDFLLFSALLPIYIQLSISYEIVSFAVFCIVSYVWSRKQSWEYILGTENLDHVSMIMFLVILGFICAGNIMSVSSFTFQSYLRFTDDPTCFALFGSLIVIKFLIPNLYLLFCVRYSARTIRMNVSSIAILLISAFDIIMLNLILLIKNEGNWVDIGISINMIAVTFIFQQQLILILIILHTFYQRNSTAILL